MSANETKKFFSTYIPNVATKSLQLQNIKNGKRKLVVSTNWLPLFGFEKNALTKEELIGKNKGIKITLATKDTVGAKKVYTRSYKNRRNNPLETLLDIRRSTLLEDGFPSDCNRVHIVFRAGEIIITPILNKKSKAIEKFKKAKDKLSTFLALSSGVDGVSLNKEGFSIETLLEFRPQERRNKNDLTETGALNALSNFKVNNLINENIMEIDVEKLFKLTKESTHTFAHFSPVCKEFSNAKSKSLKEKSFLSNDTTIDMVYDILRITEKMMFPTILIENTPNFFSSDAGRILSSRLQRFGYTVHYDKYDARDYGGLTSRVRGFAFATLFETTFNKPLKTERNTKSLWEQYIEPKILNGSLRCVSQSSSIKKGIEKGRDRFIKRDSNYSGTILKSQNQQTGDSIYIYDEVRKEFYFPSNELLSELMAIEMNFDSCSATMESEFIGQSLDVSTHKHILLSIKEHILTTAMQLSGRLFS